MQPIKIDPVALFASVDCTCIRCKKSFTFLRRTASASKFAPTVCGECADAEMLRLRGLAGPTVKDDAATARLERWLAVCPPLYRLAGDPLPPGTPPDAADEMTRPDRLPSALLGDALGWKWGSRGLGLVGTSGLGKTRAMMLLVRRLVMDEGRDVEVVAETELAEAVVALAMADSAALARRLKRLCEVEVLFLDDLGQGRMSDRVEAALWHIAETRTKFFRPTLWTAQSNTENGLHGTTGNRRRADAIERRLTQFSTVCEF